MSADKEQQRALEEAAILCKEAESHLQSKSAFFGLFSSGANYYEAADAYARAANTLKAAKCWKEAGDAFVKAGEVDIQANEPDSAARKRINAGQCYKKAEPEKAIEVYEKAIGTFVKGGRFHLAATHEKEIAEIYESQLHDYQAAIKYYLQAADRFMIDDSTAIAQSCMNKAAQLAADSEAYERAAELFEQLAEGSVHDQLRKYAVKDYLFRGGLCRLCLDDLVSAKRTFERYAILDPSFGASKECGLLTEITAAIEMGDADEYTELVTKWDRTNAMDEWKTKVLLKIKRSIEAEPSLT